MKISMESTEQVVEIVGEHTGPARVWIGRTENGIEVQVLVARVAITRDADSAEFDRDLIEQHAPPPTVQAFPLRMVL